MIRQYKLGNNLCQGWRNALGCLAVLVLLACGILLGGCGQSRPRAPVAGPQFDGEEGYHVIVVGGEPEGVAAALAAARGGMKTLLIEEGDALGGLMTLGMLNFLDMNHGPDNELLTRGIFQDFYKALGNAFDVEEAKAWFMAQAEAEPNLTVLLETPFSQPVMAGNTITGVKAWHQGQEESYRSLTVIDATVDGDVAAAAGVPYTVGGEDYGEAGTLQGVTLVFEVSGVDWAAVTKYLKNDGYDGSGADEVSAWGYGPEAQNYQPQDTNMRFRGPNIARQKDGNVLLNALVIFGVDALDPASRAEGIARGKAEIPHIIAFMREAFPGFAEAAFVDTAPRLYVRETRHIQGEYRLTITDVLENRDHWDRIGHGSYPVDVQPTGPDNYGNIIGVPEVYSIPFRCLVPLEVDQLLVAGRSASYDSLPHGSARVIPIGMVAGEACGTAVAWAVEHQVTFRQMSQDQEAISWLQEQLKKQGAHLRAYAPPQPAVMDHWAYPGVQVMRELGLTEGGYQNDYSLEKLLPSRWALQNKLNKLLRLVNSRSEGRIAQWEVSLPDDEITVGEIIMVAAQAASLKETAGGSSGQGASDNAQVRDFATEAQAMAYLTAQQVLDEVILAHCSDLSVQANYGQLLSILGALYTFLTV